MTSVELPPDQIKNLLADLNKRARGPKRVIHIGIDGSSKTVMEPMSDSEAETKSASAEFSAASPGLGLETKSLKQQGPVIAKIIPVTTSSSSPAPASVGAGFTAGAGAGAGAGVVAGAVTASSPPSTSTSSSSSKPTSASLGEKHIVKLTEAMNKLFGEVAADRAETTALRAEIAALRAEVRALKK